MFRHSDYIVRFAAPALPAQEFQTLARRFSSLRLSCGLERLPKTLRPAIREERRAVGRPDLASALAQTQSPGQTVASLTAPIQQMQDETPAP